MVPQHRNALPCEFFTLRKKNARNFPQKIIFGMLLVEQLVHPVHPGAHTFDSQPKLVCGQVFGVRAQGQAL